MNGICIEYWSIVTEEGGEGGGVELNCYEEGGGGGEGNFKIKKNLKSSRQFYRRSSVLLFLQVTNC